MTNKATVAEQLDAAMSASERACFKVKCACERAKRIGCNPPSQDATLPEKPPPQPPRKLQIEKGE